MGETVAPRVLKGFRDFHPSEQFVRQQCIQTLQNVFSSFGFVPIDTPTLEYQDVLLGTSHLNAAEKDKNTSETEKQLYAFEDNGKRAVALRFDLTVPFARYAAMNRHELPHPFNRYQIGKVFRGENTQRGRYREFIQCDFDIAGADSVYADAAIVAVLDNALYSLDAAAQNLGASVSKSCQSQDNEYAPYSVHISHRGIINALLARAQCKPHTQFILRIMDKLRKVPHDTVVDELAAYMSTESARGLVYVCTPPEAGSIKDLSTAMEKNKETLAKLRVAVDVCSEGRSACDRLEAITRITGSCCEAARIIVDPSIMRGLDYYTGFVCETFARSAEDMGSVCSGGRYNDLTKRFGSVQLEGVGASIGLDRLLAIFESKCTSLKNVRVLHHSHTLLYGQTPQCVERAFSHLPLLHKNGISAEVFFSEPSQNLRHVFKYAEKIAAQFLLIIGETELADETVSLKRLSTREQISAISLQEAMRHITAWSQQLPA